MLQPHRRWCFKYSGEVNHVGFLGGGYILCFMTLGCPTVYGDALCQLQFPNLGSILPDIPTASHRTWVDPKSFFETKQIFLFSATFLKNVRNSLLDIYSLNARAVDYMYAATCVALGSG